MFVEIPVSLKEAVRNGIISISEARMIVRSRDGQAPAQVAVVEAAPGADYLSAEVSDALRNAVKEATGVEKVLIMPPGYSLRP